MILHMIGNAHLDPVWLWPWPEGCAEAIGTCWAAVDRLDEHGGFVFTRGEARVYAWIEELEPTLFERIRGHVDEGRWRIVNGWWVQPDCNLPGGEAFVRQALYGKAYFRRAFGELSIRTAYNVDSFGHAGTLPMLLQHTGYDRYVFMRPMAHEKELPGPLFRWRSPDGSEVRTFRIPHAYTTSHTPVEESIALHRELLAGLEHDLMCFYGVGNHGGGPTRANLETIDAAIAAGAPLSYSHPDRFFDAVEGVELPPVEDELQMHAIGCYAVVAPLKALNRRAEARLAQAEAAAALARRHADAPYPRERLRELWRTLLFNQFHDILGGTSVPSATDDAVQALGGVLQGADEVLHGSVRRLAARVAPVPAAPGAAFLVFNFGPQTRSVPIEYEPWLEWDATGGYRLEDHEGRRLPHQELAPESFMRGMRRILFEAELPAYGYALFRFRPEPAERPLPAAGGHEAHRLETERWLLELDPDSGAIARLHDRLHGRDVLLGGNEAIVVDDATDTWSHGVDRFALEGERFRLERATRLEAGPLRHRLQVVSRCGDSTLRCDYLLYERGDQPLEIRIDLDWRERHRLLRLRYGSTLTQPEVRYEVPYGSSVRPADGREWPGHGWLLARDGDYGLAIANDAKYSYAARGSELYLTVARSPAMAHHDPFELASRGDAPRYADQGSHRFTVRFAAAPAMAIVDAHRLADDLLRQPLTTPHVARSGDRPQRASLLPVETDSAWPVWLKLAEESDDLVLRALELEGCDGELSVGGHGRVRLAPHSLATLLLRDGTVVRSDGLERG